MSKLHHPASLNAVQQYRQARQVLKRTSRASNPAWYQEAIELELQLHIRCDGASVTSHFLRKSTQEWTAGPPVDDSILRDPEKAATFARELITAARSQSARSIGVVLHIANEFATTELKPEFDDPSMLDELRQAAIEDPPSVLDDTSVPVEQASWRIFPYPAEGSDAIAGAAIVSRQYAPFLDVLREVGESNNFPVITHALSAPLVALTALAYLASPTKGKPFLCILQYPWFAVVGFFDPRGELKLIRAMQHRGRKRFPNFRHTLHTANISLEIIDPDVFIIALGDDADHMLGPDLQISMPESHIHQIRPLADAGELPDWCFEPWLVANTEARPNRICSNTFTMLQDEKWALQDFLPMPREIAELYPSHTEVRMLRFARLARVALFFLALAGIGWLGYTYANARMQPEWAYNPDEVNMTQARLTQLTQERERAEHWHNLLADRSKAWITMEDLVRMFPEDSGIKLKNFQYSAQPATDRTSATAGFVREWRITGLARQQGAARLNELNTREGVSAHFADVARITGNDAYRTDEVTRDILVNIRTQENRQFSPPSPEQLVANADTTYPISFDLTITQRFESDDPLALKTTAAP